MSEQAATTCPHDPGIVAEPQADRCQAACEYAINLRMCTTCGYVACCESLAAHNREHFEQTGHPIIKSLPFGPRSFTWCWVCDRYVS